MGAGQKRGISPLWEGWALKCPESLPSLLALIKRTLRAYLLGTGAEEHGMGRWGKSLLGESDVLITSNLAFVLLNPRKMQLFYK